MKRVRGQLRRAFGVADQRGSPRDVLPPPTGALAAALRRHRDRQLRGQVEVELPPGDEVHNAHGRCYVRRLVYPFETRHGDLPLAAARRVDWSRIGALAKLDDLAVDLADCVFLDTETTGLGGGAGTVVFLCGLGFTSADAFVVEQVFLRSFADEAAALTHIGARLVQRPWLVTYVGKSFDRHRLAARMAVHHVRAPVLTDRHLDLYYLARRAWREELPNCKLRTVEERRLGLFRDDDLPGSMAPMAFLDWIRDRSGPVDRVLEHNRLDVLSLVTLLARLGG